MSNVSIGGRAKGKGITIYHRAENGFSAEG